MQCPFLQETRVESCRRAAVRKLIPWAPENMAGEKCRTAAWRECPVWVQNREPDGDGGGVCPLLDEALVQFCAASPVRKFVPYSEPSGCRCAGDGFRYCDAYLTLAHPRDPGAAIPPPGRFGMREYRMEGIRVPEWLRYTVNHMWLDLSDEGLCHIGMDAFAARVIGAAERVSFVTLRGVARPGAVVTVRGVDLHLVFPNPIHITGVNLYLRADPARLTAAPYTQGWLFEGRAPEALQSEPDLEVTNGLITGPGAEAWMRKELRRLPANAGGRDELLKLFHDFFSPCASWKGHL
jgi:glycine cleavage system H lipoate-binding protein